jgi:hypothetical protein
MDTYWKWYDPWRILNGWWKLEDLLEYAWETSTCIGMWFHQQYTNIQPQKYSNICVNKARDHLYWRHYCPNATTIEAQIEEMSMLKVWSMDCQMHGNHQNNFLQWERRILVTFFLSRIDPLRIVGLMQVF